VSFRILPATAAWRHRQARSGFEVVFFDLLDDGYRARGCTTAVEERSSWVVEYDLRLDASWRTRRCAVTNRTASGAGSTLLESDGEGRWRVNGVEDPLLEGCLDVDLESSALTNALPVHRLALPVDLQVDAPAAFVRAADLRVERLEQTYTRVPDDGSGARYDYAAPVFGVACRLVYDESGLLLDYPGLAVRVE
jgi:hypothetical protein